ncbi:MAG: hypothetical protein ABI785_10255 [Gemmatimonadales bacterium]
MTAKYIAPGLVYLTVLGGAAGCNNNTGPKSMGAVDFRVSAAANAVGTGAAGGVDIMSLRLVVGPAALGSGDQFGCIDCQGNDNSSDQAELISVPTDGTPVSIATEQVSAGLYSGAEIELRTPDARVTAAAPGWPAGATVEIGGTFIGTAFTLPLTLAGEFRETLNPPVEVAAGTAPAPISVTITLPVRDWFVSNGVPLDPNDPGQRAQIENNVRLSIHPADGGETPETEKE